MKRIVQYLLIALAVASPYLAWGRTDSTYYLQFLIGGIGVGASYSLFAQGAVLIYRGSGIVNFGHGALGMVGAYITYVECKTRHDWPTFPAVIAGILASIVLALIFQYLVLQKLKFAAPITRLVATLGLLAVAQAGVELRYSKNVIPVEGFLPTKFHNWGGVRVDEQRIYLIIISIAITAALWAFTKFTRTGLAITASAQNERAVQTLGWSPRQLSLITWSLGAATAGFAGILLAPLTTLSPVGFTQVVTVAALAAALLGGFKSFPGTLLGGMVVGYGELMVTAYKSDIGDLLHQDQITGLNRGVPFLIILIVLVVRGRGLPLRSHITDRLPSLGTGLINWRAIAFAGGLLTILLFTVFNGSWAVGTYVSMSSAVIVLSVIVLTGFAGQLSLGQYAVAGLGALISGSLIYRADLPTEVAIPLGVLLTIPVGLLFALPALRTRGVNLAVVTLGMGFTMSEVVLANGRWIGSIDDGGTRIGTTKFFGFSVQAATYPHRWAMVCIIAFVLTGLMVANLRRSRTGRRLIAVRTNERAAASLGINVFAVKLYAFGVAAAIAGLGGVLVGFTSSVVVYSNFNIFSSINAVGFAVIGGVGWVMGAAFSSPNAIGGLGTRLMSDLIHVGKYDAILGGVILLLIIRANQNGAAAVASKEMAPLLRKLHLLMPAKAPLPLQDAAVQRVTPATLTVDGVTVRFGGVVAVDGVSLEVRPGEVLGLIGPNGAGKTTFIDAVTGFVTAQTGSVRFNETPIQELGTSARAKLGLRRSFQSLELFEDVSIEDNIQAGADTGDTKSWITDLFWPGRHPLPPTAVAAVRQFELEDALGKLPGELPYGQRRLAGIARAVASGPSIIMLDEPAAGLDETESRELAKLIRSMATDRGMGVLLVEHDVGLVMSTCDRIVVLEFGRVIATGTPDQVRNDPAVLAAYLGGSPDENQSGTVKA